MFPIVCTASTGGCGQVGTVQTLPSDLVCLSCMTGDHLDLDDRMAAAAYIPHKWVSQDGYTGCLVCGIPEEEAIPVNGPMIGCGQDTRPYHDQMDEPISQYASKTSGVIDDPSLPMPLLPTGTPDQDTDVDLLREQDGPRKVIVPKGSAPYTQRALSVRRSRLDAAFAVLERTANPDGSADATGPTSYRDSQTCPKCGTKVDAVQSGDGSRLTAKCSQCGWTGSKTKAVKTAAEAVTVGDRVRYTNWNGATAEGTVTADPSPGMPGDFVDFDWGGTLPGQVSTPVKRSDLTRISRKTAMRVSCGSCGHEWASRSPMGPERCPQCSSSDLTTVGRRQANTDTSWTHGGAEQIYSCYRDADCTFTGTAQEMQEHYDTDHAESITTASRVEAKVVQITAAVLQSNPGMPPALAKRVALKTVGRYPKVAAR